MREENSKYKNNICDSVDDAPIVIKRKLNRPGKMMEKHRGLDVYIWHFSRMSRRKRMIMNWRVHLYFYSTEIIDDDVVKPDNSKTKEEIIVDSIPEKVDIKEDKVAESCSEEKIKEEQISNNSDVLETNCRTIIENNKKNLPKAEFVNTVAPSLEELKVKYKYSFNYN